MAVGGLQVLGRLGEAEMNQLVHAIGEVMETLGPGGE